MTHLEQIEAAKKAGRKTTPLRVSNFRRWFFCCTSCLRSARFGGAIKHGSECEWKRAVLALLFLCGVAHAEISGVHVEQGSTGIAPGAIPITATATGTVSATVQPGAIPVVTTFRQPLATLKNENSPLMYVNGDGVNVHPYAFYVDRLVDIQPNAFNAPVNARLLDAESAKYCADALERSADKFAERFDRIAAAIKPAQDAARDVASVASYWRLIAESLGVLVVIVGWIFHAHGNRKVITELKRE